MIGLLPIFDTIGKPVDWILVHLEHVLAAVGPTRAIGAFGLAIILTTLAIRIALFPIYGWQLRAMARTQAEQRVVAPQIKQLRQKYRREPQKLSQEMQKVYKEHNVSPFSTCLGCLPALVQMPVLFALYNGIRLATDQLATDRGFLWVGDVSKTVKQACCEQSGLGGLVTHPLLLIIPGLAVATTYLQTRMMSAPVHPEMSEQERKMADMAKITVYVFPAMVGVFSYTFFQGITLYWVTQSSFMIAQQYYVRGWGSVRVPSWLPGANRTTPLSFPRGDPPVAISTPGAGSAAGNGGSRAKPAAGVVVATRAGRRPGGDRPKPSGGGATTPVRPEKRLGGSRPQPSQRAGKPGTNGRRKKRR